jgi:protein TonB
VVIASFVFCTILILFSLKIIYLYLAASLGAASSAVAQRSPVLGIAASTSESSVSKSAAPKAAAFYPDSIFVNPQVIPQFKGGEEALKEYMIKNMRYPEAAKFQRITGKVYVRFVVSAEGRITDATVARGRGHGLDEEALRLVWLMPSWQPGRQQGHPVRVSCTIPIDFQKEQ